MLIDHVGYGIWRRLPEMGYLVPELMSRESWWAIYNLMRDIGRTAFPIFCFLLVEGFSHTKSRWKFALRLLVFAFISQAPFHYAFLGLASGLNVFFTLFIAFVAMWGMTWAKAKWPWQYAYLGIWVPLAAASALLAEWLDTDYGLRGIALILIFYLFRNLYPLAMAVGYWTLNWRSAYLPGFILPLFYNGKRGLNTKYLFYIFYPAHLAVIYIIWRFLA